MIRFAEQVSKQLIPSLNKEVNKLLEVVEDKRFLKIDTDTTKAITDLEELDEKIKKCEFDAKQYGDYENTLNMAETRFENLEQLRVNINFRLDMWKGLRDWASLSDSWMSTVFE